MTIARALEIAAHAQVERAVRRVREEGQDWAVIASLLGLDALPCHVADPGRLAFGYYTGLARPPEFDRPRFLWGRPAAGRPSPTRSQLTAPPAPSKDMLAAANAWRPTSPSGNGRTPR